MVMSEPKEEPPSGSTATVVDPEALSLRFPHEEKEFLDDLVQLFLLVDRDVSGVINHEDFGEYAFWFDEFTPALCEAEALMRSPRPPTPSMSLSSFAPSNRRRPARHGPS